LFIPLMHMLGLVRAQIQFDLHRVMQLAEIEREQVTSDDVVRESPHAAGWVLTEPQLGRERDRASDDPHIYPSVPGFYQTAVLDHLVQLPLEVCASVPFRVMQEPESGRASAFPHQAGRDCSAVRILTAKPADCLVE